VVDTKVASPYYQALGQLPLREGWQWDNLGWLAVACVVVLAAAIGLFERRDVG